MVDHFSAESRQALVSATRHAYALGHDRIGTEHLRCDAIAVRAWVWRR